MKRGFLLLGICCGLLASSGAPAASPKTALVWNKEKNQVAADIQGWDLNRLLEQVSRSTGWQILLEPGTTHNVSAKFNKLPQMDALAHLLGKLNFALIPQSNAPPKLCVFKTSIGEATQLLSFHKNEVDEEMTLDNELLVMLKKNSTETPEEMSRRLGGRLGGKIDDLNGVRVVFPDEDAANLAKAALAGDPNVESVENNAMIERPSMPENVLMSSSLPFSLKPTLGNASGQIVIGLIDTPVQQLPANLQPFVLTPISLAGDTKNLASRGPTHGTSMAETVLRGLDITTAENSSSPVRILPIDIYGTRPNTTTFDVANGISTAVKNGAQIVNLSLGSPSNSRMVQTVIQNSSQQGVYFVGAAGNEPVSTPTYPAAYPEVLAVTAGNRNGDIAPFANRGTFIDVVAPGGSLIQYRNQSFYVSGTSASSAYVAGMAAGLFAGGKPISSVDTQLRQTLKVKR